MALKNPMREKEVDGSQWTKINSALSVALNSFVTRYFFGHNQRVEVYRIRPETKPGRRLTDLGIWAR